MSTTKLCETVDSQVEICVISIVSRTNIKEAKKQLLMMISYRNG